MRTNIVMLAVLAGLGLSSGGAMSADNLSCITGTSPGEQRLLRDCEPEPVEEEIIYVLQVIDPTVTAARAGAGQAWRRRQGRRPRGGG
ncbi:MAG: hypothetical protein HC861_07085, partial [Rhodospirillaceae bacterium]|nr:hypothetical protein [Rhodospirillaceae bacterium]